jgi:hypothetical protein
MPLAGRSLGLPTLTFYDSALQSEFFEIEWPSSASLTRAMLTPEKMKVSIYIDFILANAAPSEKIFFATGTELIHEHENMKNALTSWGERFDERVYTRKEAETGIFKRRKIEQRVGQLFGSTNRKEVVSRIFHSYSSWYGFSWPFSFIIAKEEPEGWKSITGKLTPWTPETGKVSIHAGLINKVQAIMVTEHEHDILFVSDKIDRRQLMETAFEVASQHSLGLVVEKSGQS